MFQGTLCIFPDTIPVKYITDTTGALLRAFVEWERGTDEKEYKRHYHNDDMPQEIGKKFANSTESFEIGDIVELDGYLSV